MLTLVTAIDSSQGLFAECIYQMCTDEEEYREFFDLPLSIYLRHPLCLSVAHKIHGKSMATGWPLEPRRLSDRKPDLNNLLFETWTSNTAKLDMTLAGCKIIRRDIERVNLNRPELYDKTGDPSSATFPKRDSRIKLDDLVNDDIASMGLEPVIEVELIEEEEEEEVKEETTEKKGKKKGKGGDDSNA